MEGHAVSKTARKARAYSDDDQLVSWYLLVSNIPDVRSFWLFTDQVLCDYDESFLALRGKVELFERRHLHASTGLK